MLFIESFLIVPDGALVGKPLKLDLFQEVFLYAVYDNPHGTRKAFLSMARKNGKTGLISGIVTGHVIGPEAVLNSQIRSGACSRDQAAIVYNQCEKMLYLNPELEGLFHCTPSLKKLVGLNLNVEYKALSADAATAHGQSPVLCILDEIGQLRGPTSPFIEALTTSQGAHDNALLIAISTSSPSDADLFSIWCDDAERSNDPHTVCHVYAADADADLMDEAQWKKANPALGTFRNEKDLREQLKQASRVPSMEAGARNLLLNQRIALESHWLAPAVWKENSGEPDRELFFEKGVCVGLDLSQRNDLTCACLAVEDDSGIIHVKPLVFTPLSEIEERARRDRVPYDQWIKQGVLIGVPGRTLSYEWIAEYLKVHVEDEGIHVSSIEFDRWRIQEFKNAADRAGFALWAEWHEVGQGFKDQSPRIEAFETALLQNKIRHGSQPVLNMGAASAIAVRDPSGNRKLTKEKASLKIDSLVACVMACYPLLVKSEDIITDVEGLIG